MQCYFIALLGTADRLWHRPMHFSWSEYSGFTVWSAFVQPIGCATTVFNIIWVVWGLLVVTHAVLGRVAGWADLHMIGGVISTTRRDYCWFSLQIWLVAVVCPRFVRIIITCIIISSEVKMFDVRRYVWTCITWSLSVLVKTSRKGIGGSDISYFYSPRSLGNMCTCQF